MASRTPKYLARAASNEPRSLADARQTLATRAGRLHSIRVRAIIASSAELPHDDARQPAVERRGKHPPDAPNGAIAPARRIDEARRPAPQHGVVVVDGLRLPAPLALECQKIRLLGRVGPEVVQTIPGGAAPLYRRPHEEIVRAQS